MKNIVSGKPFTQDLKRIKNSRIDSSGSPLTKPNLISAPFGPEVNIAHEVIITHIGKTEVTYISLVTALLHKQKERSSIEQRIVKVACSVSRSIPASGSRTDSEYSLSGLG